MLRLVGAKCLLEKETDKGRIDAILELPDKVYVIEFEFGLCNYSIVLQSNSLQFPVCQESVIF